MYYKSEFGSIYYEVYGPENAHAVMFLHGVAMDHQTFKDQISALQNHYRVIVLDMPFHGKSSKISENLRFSTTTADIIVRLLDELGIAKVTIVGLSLGSFVAQQVATKHPHRVASTVQVSGGGLSKQYPSWIKILNPLYSFFIKILPKKYLAKSFAKHKAISPDTLNYLEDVCFKTEKSVLIHMIKEMVNDMVIGIEESITQPMLIVYGDHELNFVKKLSINFHNSNPGSSLVMIKNAHHITNQDNPEEFNNCLNAFLESIINKDIEISLEENSNED